MKIIFLFPNWLWEWASTFPPASFKSVTSLYVTILAYKVKSFLRVLWHRKVKQLTQDGTKEKGWTGTRVSPSIRLFWFMFLYIPSSSFEELKCWIAGCYFHIPVQHMDLCLQVMCLQSQVWLCCKSVFISLLSGNLDSCIDRLHCYMLWIFPVYLYF